MATKIKTKTIKNNLKKYRTWKNKTQQQLADELNIAVMTVRLIENDDRYPRHPIRSKICDYFGVSQEQMFYKLEV